jgi:hypothetical protein
MDGGALLGNSGSIQKLLDEATIGLVRVEPGDIADAASRVLRIERVIRRA